MQNMYNGMGALYITQYAVNPSSPVGCHCAVDGNYQILWVTPEPGKAIGGIMKNYFNLSNEEKMNLRDSLRRGIWGTDGFVWNHELQIWEPEGEPTPEKVRYRPKSGLLDYYLYYQDMLRYVTESIEKWGFAVITDDRCPHWFLYELGYRIADEYEDLDDDDNNDCHYLVFASEEDLDLFLNGDELPEDDGREEF